MKSITRVVLAALAAAVVLAGCTTSQVPRPQSSQIKAGQSRAEVIKLIGKPKWEMEMPRFAASATGWKCSAWDQRTVPVMIWFDEYTNTVHTRIRQEIQVYLDREGKVCEVGRFETRW